MVQQSASSKDPRRGAPTGMSIELGESTGGIAPPAARRTVRKPLGLHGSHCPATGFEAEAPMSEQSWGSPGGFRHQLARPFFASTQPFILAHGPAHQMIVDAP